MAMLVHQGFALLSKSIRLEDTHTCEGTCSEEITEFVREDFDRLARVIPISPE